MVILDYVYLIVLLQVNAYKYEFQDEKQQWHEAIVLCERKGYSGILDGASKETHDELRSLMITKNISQIWTGIKRITFRDLQWINHKHLDNWNSSAFHCGYINHQSLLLEDTKFCTNGSTFGFLCQHSKTCNEVQNEENVMCITGEGRSYIRHQTPASWYEARTSCLAAGGDLATFPHLATVIKDGRMREMLSKAGRSLWVGARTFDWINFEGAGDEPVFGYPWAPGQPDTRFECVLMVRGHNASIKWETRHCKEEHHYACSNFSLPAASTKDSHNNLPVHVIAPVLSIGLGVVFVLVFIALFSRWRRRTRRFPTVTRVKYENVRWSEAEDI